MNEIQNKKNDVKTNKEQSTNINKNNINSNDNRQENEGKNKEKDQSGEVFKKFEKINIHNKRLNNSMLNLSGNK